MSADDDETASHVATAKKPKLDKESPHLSAFLTGLPSFKSDNFSRFGSDASFGYGPASSNGSSTTRRPSVYICTKDYPTEQVITTEKTNILLRYLHQQWDRKNLLKKREVDDREKGDSDTDDIRNPGPPPSKVSKLDLRLT